jgi:hypothetical protein
MTGTTPRLAFPPGPFAADVGTGVAMSECDKCLIIVKIVAGQVIPRDRRERECS